MGRPRKSIRDHLRDGTYRRDRHGPLPPELEGRVQVVVVPPTEPKPPRVPSGRLAPANPSPGQPAAGVGSDGPQKPTGLSLYAERFWDDVVRSRGNFFRASDAYALAVLAEWWAAWQETIEKLKDDVDILQRRDLLQQLSTCSNNFERYARRFGLTPADRAANKTPPNEPASGPRVMSRPRTAMDGQTPGV